MKRIPISLLSMATIFFLYISAAYAIPNLISYQGVLNDKNGIPMSSTVNMTFKIYDAATGGTALWNETQNVQVSNGLFNVKLGSVQQLTSEIFNTDSLFLGIQVGSDAEMTPRQQITSGYYSFRSDDSPPIGTIMAWAKHFPGVPPLDGVWVECNGQVLNDLGSPLNGQVIPDLNNENRFLRGNITSGSIGGEDLHTLTVAEMPSHSHSIGKYPYDGTGNYVVMAQHQYSGTLNTNATGGNQPHENRPPFYDVIWIMKVK